MNNHQHQIEIWHNILWSKYKGEVFSVMHELANTSELKLSFIQCAETEISRISISNVDLSYHRYPYTLLFKGAYEHTNYFERLYKILFYTIRSNADLYILTGYDKSETWAQLFLLLLKRKKVAIFCDSTIYDQKQKFLKGLLKKILFQMIDGVFGYGQRSKEYAIHYGANSKTIFYRCQAAALPSHYNPETAVTMRCELAPTTNAPRFLYVGRLSPEKDFDTLFAAFAIVREQNHNSTLVIVGDGYLKDFLILKVHSLGITDAVFFTGSKSGIELFKEYSKSTALVLPSISEPWGLVVNEAFSFGCPAVVSYNCGCIPELIIEGKTGFVHKTGNVADLAEKLGSAITQFSEIKTTAEDCIELINNYSPKNAAMQILKGCKQLLENKRI